MIITIGVWQAIVLFLTCLRLASWLIKDFDEKEQSNRMAAVFVSLFLFAAIHFVLYQGGWYK